MRQLQSINHCLDIMEVFITEPNEKPSLSKVTAACGLTKASTHTILANLVDRNYLVYDSNRREYGLGIRTWELGARYLASVDFLQIVQPALKKLMEHTGESSVLSRYTQGSIVYLASVRTTASVTTYTQLGARVPAYCTATGKAQLAFAPTQEIDSVLTGTMPRYTEHTITNTDALRNEFHCIQESGYAINRGEYSPDITGVGAPIFNEQDDLVGGIGISGPAYRLGHTPDEEVCHAVLDTAMTLRAQMVGPTIPTISFQDVASVP